MPCWKLHETSHAFREAEDPSQYDDWKAWFEEVNPPLADQLGGAKQALRVYTFILPFMEVCSLHSWPHFWDITG